MITGIKNQIDRISNEVDEQSSLISQITTALEGKAAGGGLDTSDATATASDILSGKTAYVDGSKVTGNIVTKTSSDLTASGATVTVPAGYYASQATKSVATATQATPSISVSSSGLITASSTQSAGYVSSGTKSATKQLTTKSATTYTPSTSNQTIASSTYLTGTQTIKGDSNLVASNIKSGVSIFGVTGTYAGGSEDLEAELSAQETLISNITTALQNKVAGGGSSSGSVETCTVTITDNLGYGSVAIMATILNNSGQIEAYYNGSLQGAATIKVLCNSVIGLADFSMQGDFIYNSSEFENMGTMNYTQVVKVKASANSNVTISCGDDGDDLGSGYD